LRVFKNIPFLRVIIPFVAGLIFGFYFETTNTHWPILPIILVLVIVLKIVKKQNSFTKTLQIVFLDAFLFLFAVIALQHARIRNHSDYYGNYIQADSLNSLVVSVNDLPLEMAAFYKCHLKVLQVNRADHSRRVCGKMIAYFKKGQLSKNIEFGQTLIVQARLLNIDAPKNPHEFDYKTFLENKQIYHTCFIEPGAFQLVEAPSALSLITETGLKVKRHLLSRLKSSALSTEAFSICAALLTGYDHEIDSSVLEAFAHSGTLHVLSVSGLHIGLIYLALSFMFDLVDRRRRNPAMKFFFVIFSLWFFALITGFAAPVLRAVIMFSILGIGNMFFRNTQRNQINILFCAAFIMLCFDPFLIKDIGFQLSYAALFGIFFFQPFFRNLWQPDQYLVKYAWQSVSASTAATLSTLPLTLFYFKQFPFWFFVCNLLVVPITFLIILLAVLVLIHVYKVALLLNYLIAFLIWFINLFNVPGNGYIDNIDFSKTDALLLTIVLGMLSTSLYSRSYKYLSLTLCLVICWQINGLIASYHAKNSSLFAVYQLKKASAYGIKNKTNVRIDSIQANNLNYHVKPHLVSFNYPLIQMASFNSVKRGASRILILNKQNHWPLCDLKKVTMLVLSNGFKLKPKDLDKLPGLRTVVVDGTNNKYNKAEIANLCARFGLEFYSTSVSGAFIQYL
jgi:competence protein ComEC